MKSILLSVRPEWVCKILNGEKTIEIRKKFPENYVGWVYIYCTKGKPQLGSHIESGKRVYTNLGTLGNTNYYNGKVVARFYCDKVEEINFEWLSNTFYDYTTKELTQNDLEIKSCLTDKELHKYLNEKNGYAIHISNLEIFDKPRELEEFNKYGYKKAMDELLKETLNAIDKGEPHSISNYQVAKKYTITKAPQNYCYIEAIE